MSFNLFVKFCSPSSHDFSGVSNVFLHSRGVCGVATCSGALILYFRSELAGWVRLDGKYVRSRLGGVVFGVRAK